MAETTRIDIGVLCDGLTFQRWQAEALRELADVPGVSITAVIMNDRPPAAARGFMQRLLRFPWRIALYLRYRRRHFKVPAMEEVDMSAELAGVQRLSCRIDQHGHSQHFTPRDLEKIAALRCDVLLRFGFNILRGEVLRIPRFGIWSFHHGDELKYRGGPPGFWELMNGDRITGAILQRLTDRLDGGVVLRKGWFRTVDHSLRDTVDTILRHSAIWPAQVCRELLAGDTRSIDAPPSDTRATVHRYPGNLTFLRFLWRQAVNKARFHREELKRHEEWNIGVLYQPIQSLLAERPSLNVRWLPSPSKGAFRADPFGFRDDTGELNVVYEKYDYAKGVGEIGRIRPKRDNILKRSRTLLNNGSHFSYPYVIELEGSRYVVPENAASGRVDLYRFTADNDGLEFDRTLLDVPLYDPTLFEHKGRWWLFGTKAPLTNVALFAYHSASPFGPFEAHAQNPVKMDVRSARPGGTPFLHNGELYRPAQDSSATYGHRIAINCVYELTPDRFREAVVKTIGPINGRYNAGLHTLSAVGDITLLDGKRWTHSKAQQQRVLKRKASRFRRDDPELENDDDDE